MLSVFKDVLVPMNNARAHLISSRCLGKAVHNLNAKEIIKLNQEIKSSDSKCKSVMPSGQFMLFKKNSVLVHETFDEHNARAIKWLDYDTVNQAGLNIDNLSKVFLGMNNCGHSGDAKAMFAFQLYPEIDTYLGEFMKVDVSTYISRSSDMRLILKANSLFRWKRQNKFCSACGNAMSMNIAGHKHLCSECGHVIYCQGTPAVSVLLVDNEKDNILLVRIPRFPEGFFSVVAGFIDIGENVEEAVEREVLEEVGLQLKSLKYVNSFPWMMKPDPLMLGFIGEVSSDQSLDVNQDEISETLWLSRDDVISMLSNKTTVTNQTVHIPMEGTLPYDLIQEWINNNS